MAEINLTQAEADALIALEKMRTSDELWDYPEAGGKLKIPLTSIDKREDFFLTIVRGRIKLQKITHQTLARQVVVLVRLCLNGASHPNPDGEEVSCPHIHTYREGFGDKWAWPLPNDIFRDLSNLGDVLNDFMRYCNVTKPPKIQERLQI